MKKTKCIALLVAMIIIGSVCVPLGSVKAATAQTIQIKNRGTMSYFRYEGELVNQRYLMHEQDGKYHPVYRISTQTENAPENIQAEVGNAVMESKIYQIIQGGYPYKTASELGCPSDFYAYIATQTAIDCYIRGYALEKLEPVSDSAEVMKQAISVIYENSLTQKAPSKLSVTVMPIDEWNFVNNSEMQKNYQVTCNYDTVQYAVSTTEDIVKICNEQNERKHIFSIEECMKLVVDKNALKNELNWDTQVRVEKQIQDIYQTESSSNGRIYALCEYRLTQEAQYTWKEMLEAYVEETKTPVEPDITPEVKPDEEEQIPSVENTKEPSQKVPEIQDSWLINQENMKTEKEKKTNSSLSTSKPNLPRTGF